MARSRSVVVVRESRQMRALASSARQEIVDVLSQMGAASAAEVAAALGRPANAVYYHLKALLRSGLAAPAGVRARGGRREALFRTPGTEVRMHYDLADRSKRHGMNAIVRSMLRLGMRDYQRALGGADVAVTGPRRDLWALRKSGWLTPGQVLEVNRHIEALARTFRPSRQGRLYGITVLLTPLERRRRPAAAARAKEARRRGAKGTR
jgi:DNA-binding transcriptional ArsR family regulator